MVGPQTGIRDLMSILYSSSAAGDTISHDRADTAPCVVTLVGERIEVLSLTPTERHSRPRQPTSGAFGGRRDRRVP